MLFNSVHFFVFAPLVIALYFILREKEQRFLLLVSSLYFYGVFRVPFTVILLFSIAITHYTALGVARSENPILRRIFLWLAVLGNLSILFFLKYLDFSILVFNQTFGLKADAALGPWGVILPMGISFFTLQAIAYVVDIYRREIEPTKSIFQFALFLSFFPQLVAGPIMRAKDLLHQFTLPHRFNKENLEVGLRGISLGLFKKTLIADPIGDALAPLYAAPHEYGWISLTLANLLFAIQIYCDFSGYSDIAIGSGRIMGFRIPINFNRPFMAGSMTELWQRWHISLSTWLRDYIYIPLGGSRVSPGRLYFNIGVTMVVGGVWHGAAWTFVFWGLGLTVFLSLERMVFIIPAANDFYQKIPRVLRSLWTFFLFGTSAAFFRAQPVAGSEMYKQGIDVTRTIFGRIFTFAGAPGEQVLTLAWPIIACVFILFAIEILEERDEEFFTPVFRNPFHTYILAGCMTLICFLIYSVTVSAGFIYFNF